MTFDSRKVTAPLSQEVLESFEAGEMILLSGEVYTARDAAHKRLVDMLERGEPAPFPLEGKVVYYAGPCPAPEGRVIGSIGPTTSGRMDKHSPYLIERGLKAMIGKGPRSDEVKEAIVKHKGVYLIAIGGAAALMSQRVESAEVVAFHDLGTEAIRRLVVNDLPLFVGIDCKGRDAYGLRAKIL
ncbi:MAG: FumA C-terminus/TtdB family hydratase beta subunit [Clostridiales bacterium]|nr:FumA C-terminus/TtdB family hydratase beta subunit [Clostridiales bacterium]